MQIYFSKFAKDKILHTSTKSKEKAKTCAKNQDDNCRDQNI